MFNRPMIYAGVRLKIVNIDGYQFLFNLQFLRAWWQAFIWADFHVKAFPDSELS